MVHRRPFALAGSACALLLAAAVVAACSAAGTPGPTGSATPSGSAAPSAGTIVHRTGPADLVLRMEVGGGFVPMGYLATEAPTFSLFGDGTVVYRSPMSADPGPVGSVIRSAVFRTGRLTEADIQALLAYALDVGGLRTAAEHYDPGNVADAPSTIFTIDAGGVTRRVSIVALGLGAWPSPEPAIAGFEQLAGRLDALDVWGKLPDTYSPAGYRTVLAENEGGQVDDIRAWPWPTLNPADWTLPTDQGRPPLPMRTMTPADVAALGIPSPEGGFQNLLLRGPDQKVYAFAARPLLPDEAS